MLYMKNDVPRSYQDKVEQDHLDKISIATIISKNLLLPLH